MEQHSLCYHPQSSILKVIPMFETIILPSIVAGLSATSVPGPMQAYILNITLNYGWRRGLWVILAPLIIDGPVIFVTVFVLQQVPEQAIQFIRVAGGLLLLWIAWGAWQQLQAGANFSANSDSDTQSETISRRKVLLTSLAMNALSPGPYLFWSTIMGPLLIKALDISLWAALGLFVAFYGTFLGGMAMLVLVFSRLGKINAEVTRNILVITIGLLVWFSSQLIIADTLNLPLLHQIVTSLVIIVVVSYLALTRWRGREKTKISV